MSICLLIISLMVIVSCSEKKEIQQSSDSNDIVPQIKFDESQWQGAAKMLIGTYTRKEGHVDGKAAGIHEVVLDPTSGKMALKQTIPAGDNPSYITIHPTGRFIYAANETGTYADEEFGTITALSIDSSGNYKILNSRSSKGKAPCFVSLDRGGIYLFAANYITGNVTSFGIARDGKLGGAQTSIQFEGSGPHPRQEAPHAHSIQQVNAKEILAIDLGSDSIHILHNIGGQLSEVEGSFGLPEGSGPRHLTISNDGLFLYILNELNGSISFLRRARTNRFELIQTISSLQEDSKSDGASAAIRISPDNKYLYVSNRGNHNDIGIFKIASDGQLNLIGHQKTFGGTPRDFNITKDGEFLIVANQESDNLVSFKIDQSSGLLEKAFELRNIPTPVSIAFF